MLFLVYFHCNKQDKKANKTDRHPWYPVFHCHLYRHYRNSSHVSYRVILTCAKIRFVLKLDCAKIRLKRKMFLQLYSLHFIKYLKDFATSIYIRHQSCMCRPYLGDLKVLNHRSKDFYFFMYIFGWYSREFPLENNRYACFDYPASASDNLIGSDFSRSSLNLAQK